jgi:hypothetical protein
VWYYSDNVTVWFISLEECKSKWAMLRSYYRTALRRRESASGQAAKKIKKWRFEEQLRFLQNHFQERGWVVITMTYQCKLNKSNTSERIVLNFDTENQNRYFTRRTTCISLLMPITNCKIFIGGGNETYCLHVQSLLE